MRKTIILYLSLVFIASLLLFSCKKQQEASEKGQLKFNFLLSNLKITPVASSDSITASTLTSVVFSIEDMDGHVIKNSEKVGLYNMDGSYISNLLSLPKGNYKVTRFFVLDWQNKVVYISPVKGSAKAYLVTSPLPLPFTIQTNNVTEIVPEVLNASGCNSEDFGYSTFSFSVAQTFDFLVGTFIYDDTFKNYKLTSSNVSIYSNGDSIYSGQLTGLPKNILINVYDSLGVTNKISLPEKYNNYTLIISKPGYKTYNQTFTKEELKLRLRSVDKGPLVVILEKSTEQGELVTDIDGNVYHTVTIGAQVWMVENLKVTKFRNGELIPKGPDPSVQWNELTTAAYSWYLFDLDESTFKNTYGLYYNWYAVADSRNICPIGWHVPTDTEWEILSEYLGGESIAGGKMKTIGTIENGNGLWHSPNEGATNESGFSALPAGGRTASGVFTIGHSAQWWSATEIDANSAWLRGIAAVAAVIQRESSYGPKFYGYSVRCIKD